MAEYLLTNYPDSFVLNLFQLPKGDAYLLESFNRQLFTKTPNLSFRDYYKVVTTSDKSYLSSVIDFASSGFKQAQVAISLFISVDSNRTDNTNTKSHNLRDIVYMVNFAF